MTKTEMPSQNALRWQTAGICLALAAITIGVSFSAVQQLRSRRAKVNVIVTGAA